MLFVVALLIWFALSVPATLIIGRVIAAAPRPSEVPVPPVPARTHSLAR